jgi:hypothetical protein
MILVALNVKELPMLIIQETLKTTANVLRDITMMVVMIVKVINNLFDIEKNYRFLEIYF